MSLLSKFHDTEAVARRCLVKKMFVEILENSQENTCVKVSFLIKLQSPVAASHDILFKEISAVLHWAKEVHLNLLHWISQSIA